MACEMNNASEGSYAPAVEKQATTAPDAYYDEAEAVPLTEEIDGNQGSSDQQPSQPAPDTRNRQTKIIYTADVRMQVDNLSEQLTEITNIVSASGGFIGSKHISDNRYRKEASLQIRLPINQFQPSLDNITALATFVDYQNLDSRDVTAEWIDLESRLATKREVRDRYIEILRNRAQKVEDILNAEEKIRRITEEIEAKEGRLRYLRDQVQLSTLSLTVYETQEYRESPETYRKSFGQQIISALSTGWELIQSLLLGLLTIWPILLMVPGLLWLWRRWRKKA